MAWLSLSLTARDVTRAVGLEPFERVDQIAEGRVPGPVNARQAEPFADGA
jgi:hypothetical protein